MCLADFVVSESRIFQVFVFFCWHKIVKKHKKKQWRTHLRSTYKLAFLRIKNLMKFHMQKTRRFKFECLIKILIYTGTSRRKKTCSLARFRTFSGKPEAKRLAFHYRNYGFVTFASNYQPVCRTGTYLMSSKDRCQQMRVKK